MIVIAIVIGCIIGALIGMNAPVIPYTYSTFLAIAVVAALDSVFGGITSVLKKNFDLNIFISGFFFRHLFYKGCVKVSSYKVWMSDYTI